MRQRLGIYGNDKMQFWDNFSKHGVSGRADAKYANRERLKRPDKTILVFSEGDLQRIADGSNFFSLLRDKYEESRLELPPTAVKPTSPARRKKYAIGT